MISRAVLLLAQQLTQGGSERQLAEIAMALDRDLFIPHAGVLRQGGFRADELVAASVPVSAFPLRSFASPAVVTAAWQMRTLINRQHIQLVHAFDTPMNLFAVPIARASGVPVILSSQRAFRELTPPFYRRLLRVTDRMVDAVVVNCRALQRHMVEDEKVPDSLIRICYNGIDTTVFKPRTVGRPAILAGARCVIGAICALREEKSLVTLIEAFARVRRPGTCLLIVGSGPMLSPLLALRNRLGLADSCLFQPSVANVADWLNAIDIFVLPSRSEALSNSLMEAMACGCAAVASRVGGNPELIEHGRRGLLFKPQDVEDLAAQLAFLLDQEDARHALAEAGRRFLHENFRLADAARRMGEIYLEFLDRRKKASQRSNS